MSDEKNTEEFIDDIAIGNFNKAKQWFDAALQSKVDDALEAEKINVANQIFNSASDDDDLDEEDDDIVVDEIEEEDFDVDEEDEEE